MFDSIVSGLVLATVALLWIVLLVRIVGLRSFSKMTSFDFIMTIAMGSLVGSASRTDEWGAFIQSLAAMAALFGVQFLAAKARQRWDRADAVMQNEPVLLVRDGVVIEEALQKTRVGKGDLMAKLRAANVGSLKDVRAVVLETTGDVSVMHGKPLDEDLLYEVQRGVARD
ncbi:DUF421 domain-containing protein [Tsuneonella sp. SYSU-LHT278]|uniref:DUF421 domain-containing protein n=1 Tax=Tsuneonella sediminis TaxID=3416089 RepID=UPI003F7A0F6F